MEVKAGYKQTDVGVIPEDWEAKPIGDLFSISVGRDLRENNYSTSQDAVFQYPVFSNTVSNEGLYGFYDFPEYNGESLTIVGRGVGLGTAFKRSGGFGAIGRLLVLFPKENINATFATEYINHRVQIFTESGGIPQLTGISIAKYRIPVPPTLAEQEAIADALSDADALIEALEQLLTKKRQVKQGVMQELLRVKDNWTPTNLGSIADPNKRWSYTGGPFGSNLKASDYTDDGIRVIQLQNIGDGEFKADYEVFTSKQKADELLSCNIYPGEIILSKMGDPVARACIIPRLHERYVMCSDGIRLAVDQKRFDTYFVYIVINARDFRTKAENAGVGSTRKRIGLTELRNLELFCPPLPEQTAIAEILGDMDAEIAALEAKLTKARQIKQGMMQELLTGRVRLVTV